MPNLLTRLSEWTNARRKLVWLVLFVLVVVVVTIVLTPVFLIMPFKAQTPRTMEISYLMRRWSPLLTVLGSLTILVLTIGLWFGGRWWSLPFKAQTPRTMEISYLMRRWSPLLTVLGSLTILVLTIGLWFGGRWWSRALMLL